MHTIKKLSVAIARGCYNTGQSEESEASRSRRPVGVGSRGRRVGNGTYVYDKVDKNKTEIFLQIWASLHGCEDAVDLFFSIKRSVYSVC